MRLLVLGGTAWLGGEIATVAVTRGHDVTCLARGTGAPAGVSLVRADRDQPAAYDAVPGPWDAVIDVSRQPGHVRRAVAALEPVTGHYLLVSTGNVYADASARGSDEDAELLPALVDDVAGLESYGEGKVACEQAVLAAFGPERSLVARAGLIGGPGDTSGRSGYWPWRFAHPADPGGRVLVPAAADAPTQVVDVRDLAGWLVTAAESATGGAFNAVGESVPFSAYVASCREVAGHTGPVVEADEEWLVEQGVEPWMGPRSLPNWLPDASYAGFADRDGSRAVAAGLVRRPLAETLGDVLAWELTQAVPHGAGLTDDEERALLAELPVGGAR